MKPHDASALLGINRRGVGERARWDEGQSPVHSAESIQRLGLAIGLISHRLTRPCINFYPVLPLMRLVNGLCWEKKICDQNLQLSGTLPTHSLTGKGCGWLTEWRGHHFQKTICQSQNWSCHRRLSMNIRFNDKHCLHKNQHHTHQRGPEIPSVST